MAKKTSSVKKTKKTTARRISEPGRARVSARAPWRWARATRRRAVVFWSKKREKRINPHKSFKRSYREDYQRSLEIPGITQHIFATFKILFQNWKLFLPLLIIATLLYIVFVGVVDQSSYTTFQKTVNQSGIGNFAGAGLILLSTITSNGLSGNSGEAAVVFGVLIFLLVWLTTIFLLRHTLAGHKIKLRDGLYNAMTPLVSTFVVLVIAAIQAVPIMLLIIAYSAAVQTDFLATPFYALLFLVFALLMLLISGYLLSSTLIALVAVSAPGLYPLRAVMTASDLMMSRRIKFIIRLIALIIALALIWIIIMLPLIMFDVWMKSFAWAAGIPFVQICLAILICFTMIYITAYLYLYYRWMLDYEEK